MQKTWLFCRYFSAVCDVNISIRTLHKEILSFRQIIFYYQILNNSSDVLTYKPQNMNVMYLKDIIGLCSTLIKLQGNLIHLKVRYFVM